MERVSWQPLALLLLAAAVASGTEVGHDGRSMVIDGERRLLISGSIHYPRSTPEMWPDLIRKAKEGGLTPSRPRDGDLHDLIVDKLKEAKMFAGQGGPIILSQIENEYGNVMDKLNNDESASEYIHWCAAMANKQNVGVLWIMCQQDQDVPPNVINTCNGFYCHDWFPKRTDIPRSGLRTDWFKAWDKPDFHRSVKTSLLCCHVLPDARIAQNYYMYHGGTNFGRTSGGPYITTSYDYDALLMSTVTKYTLDNSSACFISNKFDDKEVNVTLDDGATHVGPSRWSVSILSTARPSHNSAKIKTQTSGNFRKNELLEQIATSGDQSDYLWYRTSLEHKGESNYKLHVNTTGHELYAFVNGKLVGRHYAPNGGFVFQMETPVKLHLARTTSPPQRHHRAQELWCSVRDDARRHRGGPVKLVDTVTNTTAYDLSNSSWSYKAGLAGEYRRPTDKAKDRSQWRGGTIPVHRPSPGTRRP
ncbi:hypothetical protein ZWY2020_015112 [Hordeum vulgare]|nr:hypothetical protein ZWY2020_015112 [Hordeum vulgare]